MSKTTNPFPGLRSFRTDEKHLFFGREDHTVELLRRLRETRFLAVVGTSGSGKSSLVRAGVLPELHKGTMTRAGSNWEIAVTRPGGSPMMNLAMALVEADLYDPEQPDVAEQVHATLRRSRHGLSEAARQSELEEGANLLVVIDQFEELFRFRRSGAADDQAEAVRFVQLLLTASAKLSPPIYVVLTMRSDYLGDCTAFPGLAEAVNASEYLIPRMNRDQRRSAIEGPVKVAGATVAPRLLQKLLNDLGDDPDQLPILQHALMRTWDQWEAAGAEEGPLDLAQYESAGEMREALSRHADEVYESLPLDRLRLVAAQIFKALTERGPDDSGIRRPTRLVRLAKITNATDEEARAVVEAFRTPGRTFLMPPVGIDLGPDTVIDISHESLMRVWHRLRDWTAEEERSASIYRRLADTARLWKQGQAGLYQDPDLQIARSWWNDNSPNAAWANRYGGDFETAKAFLEKSREAAEATVREKEAATKRELERAQQLARAERARAEEQSRSARRLRWLVALMAVVIAVALAAMQIARSARKEAQQARDQARQTLSNKAFRVATVLNREGKSREAVAQLCEAVRNDPSNELATELLLSILLFEPIGVPLYKIQPLQGIEPPRFVVSSDGARVVGYTEQSAVVWDLRSGEKLAGPIALNEGGGRFPEENTLLNYADEMSIHLRGSEGSLRLDLQTGATTSQELAPQEFGEIGLSLRDEIAWQILAKEEGVKIIDLRKGGEALSVTFKVTGEATRALIGPKGRWLAIESHEDNGGSQVSLFDIQTGKQILPQIPKGDLGKIVTNSEGNVIILGFENGLIKGWSVDSADPREVLSQQLPRTDVTPISLSTDAKRLTAFDDRGVCLLWDLESDREITPHTGRQNFVARGFGQNGTTVLTVARDRCIWVWETVGQHQIPMAFNGRVPSAELEFAMGGARILRTPDQRILEVLDLPSGTVLMKTPEHANRIDFLAANGGGDQFVTVAGDLLQVWRLGSPNPIGQIDLDREVSDVCVFADGSKLALAADTTVSIWSLGSSELSRESVFAASEFVEFLEVHSDGSVLALVVGDNGSDIDLRAAASGEPLHSEYLQNPDRVVALSFSGDRLYSASGRSIRTWSIRLGEEIAEPILHEGIVTALAVSPDGRRLASSMRTSSGYKIRVWDSRTGSQMSPAIHHEFGGETLGFSANGDRLFTGQHIWELRSGEMSLPDWFIEFAEAVAGMAVAPSGANEFLDPDKFLGAVEKLAERTESDGLLSFAKWFAADKLERLLSPTSNHDYQSYISRLKAENSPASLEEATRLEHLKH